MLGPLPWLYRYRITGGSVSSPTPVLYAVHPHGRLAAGAALAFLANPAYPGYLSTHSLFFRIPVYLRELFLWHGM